MYGKVAIKNSIGIVYMKKIKITLKIILLVSLILPVWIYLNSIDDEYFDDREMLSKEIPVSPGENGYTAISYLCAADFELLSLDDDNNLSLHVHGDSWDQSFVDRILAKNENLFKGVKITNSMRSLKLPEMGLCELSGSYYIFMRITDLHLLKAKNYINSNLVNNAISTLGDILIFGEKIKGQEGSSTMFSYLIGLGMQQRSLNYFHKHLLVNNMNAEQYDALFEAVDQISPYGKADLDKAFIDEYRGMKAVVLELSSKTLHERYASYKESILEWQEYTRKNKDSQWAKPGMYEFMLTLLPAYYLHPNKILKAKASDLENMSRQSSEYCANIKSRHYREFDELNTGEHWTDIIMPGSLTERLLESKGPWKMFFEDRCFGYVYIDAIKTIIALEKYKMERGDFPEKLETLVPDYMENMPVDYFSGDNLLYSRTKGWLYSVGANYLDNAGGKYAIYFSLCRKGSACYTNPTIPINLAASKILFPPSSP